MPANFYIPELIAGAKSELLSKSFSTIVTEKEIASAGILIRFLHPVNDFLIQFILVSESNPVAAHGVKATGLLQAAVRGFYLSSLNRYQACLA